MSWATDNLHKYLEPNGNLLPPWARFPEYERYSLGWRMGSGESWFMLWWAFLGDMPDIEARVAYLQRHPAAPFCWADTVYDVLHPDEEEEPDEIPIGELLDLGLVASDVAFPTWLARQKEVQWPWAFAEDPQDAARYSTRDFWFATRHLTEQRQLGTLTLPEVPAPWQTFAPILESGEPGALQLDDGLESLARMFCAGRVAPPWRLGLPPEDFKDSFDDDMGYSDAFRLWLMTTFDDRPQVDAYLDLVGRPDNAAWSRFVTAETEWLLG